MRRHKQAGFLRSRSSVALTGVLLLQAALVYGFSRTEVQPAHVPLGRSPAEFGAWSQIEEGVIEEEIRDVLKADDLLNRTYAHPAYSSPANLFVAFFKSQRTGQTPHSPKNCLPGAGWTPSKSDFVSIDAPGRATPLEVNRYVVQRGESKSLVLYWYQSRDRVVAHEYWAKLYVIADAIRYNRTDTALVRVVVPVMNGDEASAQKAAEDFIRSFYQPLRAHFPAG